MKKIIIIVLLINLAVPVFALEQMQTTDVGKRLIKSFEGFRARAYRCPANVWTIGWGNTSAARPGKTITIDEGEGLFDKDLLRFEKYVNQGAARQFDWNEFDALVSFCYNCGYRFRGELREAVNLHEDDRFEILLKQYCHAKGKKLAGLKKRRNIEFILYLTGTLDT